MHTLCQPDIYEYLSVKNATDPPALKNIPVKADILSAFLQCYIHIRRITQFDWVEIGGHPMGSFSAPSGFPSSAFGFD